MTPPEALQILDSAASQAALNRNDHLTVQRAVVVLQEALAPKPDNEEPSAED